MNNLVKRTAFTIILMGTMALFGNFLWLIGILPKPEESLMCARWIYGITSYILGSMIFIISTDSTIDL